MAPQPRGYICYGNREKQMLHFIAQVWLPTGLGKNLLSHLQIIGNNWPYAKLVPPPLFSQCTGHSQEPHWELSMPCGEMHVFVDELVIGSLLNRGPPLIFSSLLTNPLSPSLSQSFFSITPPFWPLLGQPFLLVLFRPPCTLRVLNTEPAVFWSILLSYRVRELWL